MKKWSDETKSFIDGVVIGGMMIIAYNYFLSTVAGV